MKTTNSRRSIFRRRRGCLHAIAITLSLCSAAVGHESDQYSVPLGREFADLRLYFSEWVHAALDSAVEKTNARIRSALRSDTGETTINQLQSPETIAWAVLLEFPPVLNFIERLELDLRSAKVQSRYPGLLVAYMPTFWIYHHWALLLDPTKLIRLGRSSTIMIDGVYCGTDKVAHFFHMGYLYFSSYRKAKTAGLDEAAATGRAVSMGSNSEDAFLGILTTGVRSNADLAANYMGFKFYRNLTEPVALRGRIRPALLVRDGPFWRLNDHVQANSDFFADFVSNHWDEALNPSTYASTVRRWLREALQDRCENSLDWYRDENGRRRTKAAFGKIAHDLSTYFGEDYGHQGGLDAMVTIATVCFERESVSQPAGDGSEKGAEVVLGSDSEVSLASRRAFAKTNPDRYDSFRRTPLWWAAANGDLDEVRRLIGAGADVTAADIDFERPLHVASRWGHVEVVEQLLRSGAEAGPKALYHLTPLHLSARELRCKVALLLLEHGADVNAADQYGCTPLHDAAARGLVPLAAILIAKGADPNAQDIQGTTPLHRAARAGHGRMATFLLTSGADPTIRSLFDHSPREEAKDAGHEDVALLISRGFRGESETPRRLKSVLLND